MGEGKLKESSVDVKEEARTVCLVCVGGLTLTSGVSVVCCSAHAGPAAASHAPHAAQSTMHVHVLVLVVSVWCLHVASLPAISVSVSVSVQQGLYLHCANSQKRPVHDLMLLTPSFDIKTFFVISVHDLMLLTPSFLHQVVYRNQVHPVHDLMLLNPSFEQNSKTFFVILRTEPS
ncbi:hypothetical protein J6590_062384 [Homalodisca vitripennis]|nr:hypothetical protein J6590_062384 [Homalodisca vitripennis]